MNAIMFDSPLIISSVFFVIIFTGVLLINYILIKKALRQDLLKKINLSDAVSVTGETDEDEPQAKGLMGLAIKYLGFVGKSIVPEKSDDYVLMKRKFLQAGLHNSVLPPIFWGLKVVLALVLPLAGYLGTFLLNNPLPMQSFLLACLAVSVFGYYLPDILLYNKIIRRREMIKKGLPDMLDLMVVCVEAGLGLDATIRRITGEIRLSHKELSNELLMYGLELNAGMSREQALRNLSSRVNLETFQNLVGVLLQTDRFGTSIANALRIYSESFRNKRYAVAEEKAAKLAVKITFPVILFIFPAMFVVLAGPAAIRIFEVM
jgi:tight adherence protein C